MQGLSWALSAISTGTEHLPMAFIGIKKMIYRIAHVPDQTTKSQARDLKLGRLVVWSESSRNQEVVHCIADSQFKRLERVETAVNSRHWALKSPSGHYGWVRSSRHGLAREREGVHSLGRAIYKSTKEA